MKEKNSGGVTEQVHHTNERLSSQVKRKLLYYNPKLFTVFTDTYSTLFVKWLKESSQKKCMMYKMK